MAKERFSLTIHKVFYEVIRWSPVLVTVQTWPRNGCHGQYTRFFSEKVESSSSHGSDMAKEWLAWTIYKVVLSK